jgi:hypothetical protein
MRNEADLTGLPRTEYNRKRRAISVPWRPRGSHDTVVIHERRPDLEPAPFQVAQ